MSTKFLLVLALDFLGAGPAGRLESGAGDVGEAFRLAAVLFVVDGNGVVVGEGGAPPERSRGGLLRVAGTRVEAPSVVAGDELVAFGRGGVAVEGLRGR